MINSLLLIFFGIMSGQFLYMCTLWLQHKRKEYAFYIIHYLILVYFLFGVSYTYYLPTELISRHKNILNWLGFHPLHIFNFFLYIKFSQYFLEAPKKYPYLNLQAKYLMRGTWVAFVITTLAWHFYENNSRSFFIIYMGLYICMKLWAIWVLYIVYKQQTRETGYILRATIFLSGGLVCIYALLALVDAGLIERTGWIFIPCVVGILGEIYYVNSGLAYKASLKRRSLIESQQQWINVLERNKVLLQEKENVRNDLSLQLNKEVGITLDGIGLFAEHTLQRFKNSGATNIEPVLQRIVTDSSQMVTNMNDIVWVLTAENDTVMKAIQRIQSQCGKFCREKNIVFEFSNQFTDIQRTLDMKERRELYRGWKELVIAFINCVENRMIVKIEGSDHELKVNMEGMRKKDVSFREFDLPELGELFKIKKTPLINDNYYRLEFTFNTNMAM